MPRRPTPSKPVLAGAAWRTLLAAVAGWGAASASSTLDAAPATPVGPSPPAAPAAGAAAAAGSMTTMDLDGDGRAEEIAARGAALEIRGGATVRLPGRPRLDTLAAVALGGERLIGVEVTLAGGAIELWVGRRAAGGFTELARLPMGPQGSDGEYGAAAELSARGLVRWQTRPDLVRCDGAALRLFAERWEPASRRWLAAETSDVPASGDGAATVVAMPPAAPGAPAGRASDVFRARSTTSQRGAQRADELAIPSELDDGDVKTAWRSGGDGDGRGEVLGFRARLEAGKALRLRVVPGDAGSPAALRAAGRPAKLWLIGKRLRFSAVLPDPAAGSGAAYLITLPRPIEECLSVVVESIYPGSGSGSGSGSGAAPRPLAISELSVETDLEEGGNGTAALAAQVAKGGDEGVRAATVLARRGAPAAAALLGELSHTTDVAQKRRLARALAQLSEREIGEPLTAGVRDGWIDAPDLDAALAALARIGADGALAEIVEVRTAPLAARLGAARRLAATRSPLLIAMAGVGPLEVRKELIAGLSTLPTADLLTAADAAGEASATGDLWRAAVRAALHGDAGQRRQLAGALRRLSSVADYERRYRLATAHAELAAVDGDAAALTAVLGELAALPEPEAAALRQAVASVATRAARATHSELVAPLEAMLRDRDAGVRLAAVRGLADPGPGNGSAPLDGALIGRLSGDGWPELRRAAAAALGKRCQRAEPAAALVRSVAGDADVDVRQDALVALVTCGAPGIGDRLVQLWDSGAAPLPLRSRAVTLAVLLGDLRLSPLLIRSLTRWRSEAFSDEAALHLAVLAAGAIGQLGGPQAAGALLAALEDSAYPELVAAAATGLGALGPACPAIARQKLSSLMRSDERAISLAARRAVSRCGATAAPRGTPDAP